jgi:6-phospho-beta-glucosidase
MAKVIAIIGGGSVWTPHLLELMAEDSLGVDTQIRLQGPTESHLQEVASFGRYLAEDKLDVKVVGNLEEALGDADIILNQARIGGWTARIQDEILPMQFGLFGDESLGLGGLCAAARTWSFITQASKVIVKYAPSAWLLNLTNPSDLVSYAWRKAGCQRVASVCDLPQTFMHEIANLVGKPEDAYQFGFMGMSHVGWLLPPSDLHMDDISRLRPELSPWIHKWGAIPTPWRMYLSNPDALFQQQQQRPGHRARRLMRLAGDLRSAIRNQDERQYRRLLIERYPGWYSLMVIPAIQGLLGLKTVRLVVGVPHKANLCNLDIEVHLESWAIVNRNGIHHEPYPNSVLCQQDVLRFGSSRASAYQAFLYSDSRSIAHFATSDVFVSSVLNARLSE